MARDGFDYNSALGRTTPMPSPTGSNHEQLYMNAARRELRAPGAAYDEVTGRRHPLARIARDNEPPAVTADDAARIIALMLLNLPVDEAERLMEIMGEMAGMSTPEDVVEEYAGNRGNAERVEAAS